jgi:hypothetical protein
VGGSPKEVELLKTESRMVFAKGRRKEERKVVVQWILNFSFARRKSSRDLAPQIYIVLTTILYT